MHTTNHGRRLAAGLVFVLVLSAAGAASRPTSLGARAAEARVYVTVVDAKNQPVAGLTTADFVVQVEGVNQEVISAVPATEPVSVMLLTDRLGIDPTYTVFDVGQVLGDYVKTIRQKSPESKFALTTFDGTSLSLVKFTSPPNDLNRTIGRLGTMAEDAVLLEALMDVCKVMKTAPTERRVIMTLLAAYRPERSNIRNDVIAEELRLSKASLWVVEVRQSGGGNYASPVREQMLDGGSQMSGGFRDIVGSRSGLGSITKRMAELVGAQYAVTYALAGGTARSALQVGVKRTGVKIFAPRWLSQ